VGSDDDLGNTHLMVRGRFARRVKAWATTTGVPVIYCKAALYCSTTLAGMRPRSLTARPCSFAHARISPERWRFAAVLPER